MTLVKRSNEAFASRERSSHVNIAGKDLIKPGAKLTDNCHADCHTSNTLQATKAASNKQGKLLLLRTADTEIDKVYQGGESDSLTTRTELSTEIDEFSLRHQFSLSSTSYYTAKEAHTSSFSFDFGSNRRTKENRFVSKIIENPLSCTSDLTSLDDEFQHIDLNQTGNSRKAYSTSLLDIDDDECSESDSQNNSSHWPKSPESMFIRATLDSDSRIGFYGVSDLDRTDIPTAVEGVFSVSSDVEEPLSCREKALDQPTLSCDENAFEFDWLSAETKKIEEKRKNGDGKAWANGSCDGGVGLKRNLNSFVSKFVGSCLSPTPP